MLRLYDSRLQDVVSVQPARRGQLRMYIAGPGLSGPARLGDLRTAVTGDLIRRTAERRRLAAIVSQGTIGAGDSTGASDDHESAFHAACLALGIRPAEFTPRLADPADLSAALLGPVIDVYVSETAGSAPAAGHDIVRHWVTVEHTQFEDREPVTLADITGRGLDPLALRLAFLDHHYRQPLDLTWPALAEADATVRRWRAQVADWATHPSRPLSSGHAAPVIDAFEDDLDTPAALRALRDLAGDAGTPPGARFETFAHLDQFLSLDLASEIGQSPAPARHP